MSEEAYAGPPHDPDKYTLGDVVGGGGEGAVRKGAFAVRGEQFEVAVKVLRPDRFPEAAEPPEEVEKRWMNHAAHLQKLAHTGIVGVHEAFRGAPPHHRGETKDGHCVYFVMDWIEGDELATWVAGVPNLRSRLAALHNVADALDEMHRNHLVHGDVKPTNVLVRSPRPNTGSTRASTVLVDFGVMRSITNARPSKLVVSQGYAAPELFDGAPYSALTDVYALAGVVLFVLTNDHPPDSRQALVDDVPYQARQRLIQAGVPMLTVEAVAAALDPDPARRPAIGCSAWLATARNGLTSSPLVTTGVPGVGAAAWSSVSTDAGVSPSIHPPVAATAGPAPPSPPPPVAAPAVPAAPVLPWLGPPAQSPPAPSPDGEAEVETVHRPRPAKPPERPRPRTRPARRRWMFVLPAALAVVAGAVVAYLTLPGGDPGAGAGSQDPPSADELAAMVGDGVGEVRDELAGTGVEVDVTETINDSEPDGTVLDIERRPDDTIVLTVGRRSVSRLLMELDPVETSGRDHQFGAFELSGDRYTRALRLPLDRCGAGATSVDYDLSRDYHRFLAAVGPDDEADRAARVRVEVIVDRETVQTYELGFDETASIDLDVTGALRLQLRATLLEPDGQCVSSAAAVLADPRLLGVPWELEAG